MLKLTAKPDQGYDITHPDIELLKLRNYTVSTKLDDEGFCMDGVQDKLADILRALRGLVRKPRPLLFLPLVPLLSDVMLLFPA